jgi:hypothetical protein
MVRTAGKVPDGKKGGVKGELEAFSDAFGGNPALFHSFPFWGKNTIY